MTVFVIESKQPDPLPDTNLTEYVAKLAQHSDQGATGKACERSKARGGETEKVGTQKG